MSKPCVKCGENKLDLSGDSLIEKINKLLADNYTVITIAVILIIFSIILCFYFVKQLIKTIRTYKDAVQRMAISKTTNPDDDESYDEDSNFTNPMNYYPENKKTFVKKIDKEYKEYNKAKDDYIRNIYQKEPDDDINQSSLYGNYDNYSYEKKE